MEILYDDKYITLCIKDPKLLSEKSENGQDILTMLDEYYSISNQNAKAFPLHRLDFGVGGVMVFAKSSESAAKMSALIQNGGLVKEYMAVVCGNPGENSGTYRDLLFKDSKKNKSFVVTKKRTGVKEAVLDYELTNTKETADGNFSLVRIRLHTGRSHQIRVQFSSRNIPLYGDRKYGAKQGKEIALWSYRLSFTHPYTKDSLVFEKIPHGEIWEMF